MNTLAKITRYVWCHAIIVGLTCALLSQGLYSSDSFADDGLTSQMVPMRDGIHLSTDVHFNGDFDHPRPTLFARTVYNKDQIMKWNPDWQRLLKKGYAIVTQDIRGRYESEGTYQVARGRREDGVDTLDWIVAQPWSNGKVGLAGCSYQGEAQVVLEATNHPALVAGYPQSSSSGYYRPGRAWQSFSGGAFEMGQTAGWFMESGAIEFAGPNLTGKKRSAWFNDPSNKNFKMVPKVDFGRYLANISSLPVLTLLSRSGAPRTDFEVWRASHPDGAFFHSMDLVTEADRVSVPNLFFDTWYDYGARETLMMAEQFRQTGLTETARSHQYVVIGPGTHCNLPETEEDVSAGPRPLRNAQRSYREMQESWYDYWLMNENNNVTERPFLTYYVLGLDEWRTADQWPLDNTQYTKWYLGGDTPANSKSGGGLLTHEMPQSPVADSFEYDPGNPVPSLGGHTCCTGTETEAGGYDQSDIEDRKDVLVYTSKPLQDGIEVTGLLKAHLFVSSTAVDTDFTVKLVDVYPTGEAYNVQEGVLRMRYRESLTKPKLINPHQIYEIMVDLNATSNYFGTGHRIRIEISSSNFPRIERNLNTGEHNALGTTYAKAMNTVWRSAEHTSYIELPVISRPPS